MKWLLKILPPTIRSIKKSIVIKKIYLIIECIAGKADHSKVPVDKQPKVCVFLSYHALKKT